MLACPTLRASNIGFLAKVFLENCSSGEVAIFCD